MNNEIIESMVRFGITNNQAKVYLATLSLGESSVEPISKLSKVRREDVYRALPRLHELGLVHNLIGTPLKVKAVPVQEAIDILLYEKREKMESELEDLVDVSRLLAESPINYHIDTVENKNSTQFELIEGKVATRKKDLELIDSFRKTMFTILPDEQMLVLLEHIAFDPRSVDRDRSIKVIISLSAQSKSSPIRERLSSKLDHVDIRFVDGLDTFFSVYDEERGSLYVNDESNKKILLLTSNTRFVSLLNNNFTWLWSNAKRAPG
jgi:sugar-specific transcriptional regulator TrmB